MHCDITNRVGQDDMIQDTIGAGIFVSTFVSELNGLCSMMTMAVDHLTNGQKAANLSDYVDSNDYSNIEAQAQ